MQDLRLLEAALKRAAWHDKIPSLVHEEARALGRGFQNSLIEYLKNPEERILEINTLPTIQEKVREVIRLAD